MTEKELVGYAGPNGELTVLGLDTRAAPGGLRTHNRSGVVTGQLG